MTQNNFKIFRKGRISKIFVQNNITIEIERMMQKIGNIKWDTGIDGKIKAPDIEHMSDTLMKLQSREAGKIKDFGKLRMGLEPTTCWLRISCTTSVLHQRNKSAQALLYNSIHALSSLFSLYFCAESARLFHCLFPGTEILPSISEKLLTKPRRTNII